MRNRFLLLLVLGLCCLGMGKKKPQFTVRFYVEGNPADTSSFSAPITLLNGQQAYVDLIAQISERDILAVYPFPMPDGSGGCTFKLDDHGTMALDSLSTEKRGSLLIATLDGRQISDIVIDKRVSDGIVTIPNGITTDEMKDILKRYPIIGEGGKAKTKKPGFMGLKL